MSIDVGAVRAATPGASRVMHFNNAGSSLPPQVVIEAMTAYLHAEAEFGGYETEAARADDISRAYAATAELIGADPSEIAMMESASAAWINAFQSFRFKPGDRVITARAEYVSNAMAMITAVERDGVEIVLIDDDADGQVDLDALDAAIDERTRLVAITHVPTSGGLINPAARVGAIARRYAVPFLLDACQSVGQLPIDVDDLGCDLMVATGRKFLRAPRGTGFLYVRSSLVDQLRPLRLDGRSANWIAADQLELAAGAQRFEMFECSFAARVGYAAAVDYALTLGLREIEERNRQLAARLRAELAAVPGVTLRDLGQRQCAIVTFDLDGVAATTAQTALCNANINVSLTRAQSSQFDLGARGLDQLVRASVHYFNTDDEIDALIAVVRGLC